MRRKQRQRKRHKRLQLQYNVYPQRNRQQFRHRHLQLEEADDTMARGYGNYREPNTARFHRYYNVPYRPSWKESYFSGRRLVPQERQAGVAGLFVGNSAGAGLAWFASLVGLAAVAREPLKTVLGGVSPWNRILNSKCPDEQ